MARILVVDDDALVRETLKELLESGGHVAVLAVDGEDAIKQFRIQLVELVICDVFMPHKEGLETIREIRELAPAMPIISMTGGIPPSGTGSRDLDFLRMTAEFGATRMIAKPFKVAELLALVQQCLDERAPPTATGP